MSERRGFQEQRIRGPRIGWWEKKQNLDWLRLARENNQALWGRSPKGMGWEMGKYLSVQQLSIELSPPPSPPVDPNVLGGPATLAAGWPTVLHSAVSTIFWTGYDPSWVLPETPRAPKTLRACHDHEKQLEGHLFNTLRAQLLISTRVLHLTMLFYVSIRQRCPPSKLTSDNRWSHQTIACHSRQTIRMHRTLKTKNSP
jgi:hypothetical protein